jgi:hypothetical protein
MSQSKLTDLLAGIQSAVAAAMQQVEMQHTNMLKKYFDIDESGSHITAKTVAIEIPARNTTSSNTEIINVPLVTLVPIRSLKIEKISLDFEARISAVELQELQKSSENKTDKKKHSDPEKNIGSGYQLTKNELFPQIYIEMKKSTFATSTTPVKISIEFKDNDPPEGIVRVSEHILNQIK